MLACIPSSVLCNARLVGLGRLVEGVTAEFVAAGPDRIACLLVLSFFGAQGRDLTMRAEINNHATRRGMPISLHPGRNEGRPQNIDLRLRFLRVSLKQQEKVPQIDAFLSLQGRHQEPESHGVW